MRTKLLLGAAILAAGLASSMAQAVYSLNVVGYVQASILPGHWYLWGNPVSNGANDSETVLTNWSSANGLADLGAPGDAPGATVFCFNQPAGAGYGNPDQFYYAPDADFIGWNEGGNVNLTPGNGFWFFAPPVWGAPQPSWTSGTMTFTGTVVTNNSFTLVPGWNLVSSAFPVATNLNALGLIGSAPLTTQSGNPIPGDFVLRWNVVSEGYANGWDNGITYYNDVIDTFVGWATGDNNDPSGTEGPVLSVGEGIWVQHQYSGASTVTWTQSFSIQ